ncbi:MAG: queuosine precursor transporter [Paludibacter sp.]|nr:queuosine precursor transporter [Paludibacter sp.]
MRKQVSVAFMMCGLLFTVSLIIANIVTQKLINIHGFEITAGLLIFPITYIINDLIAEVWGYRKMRLIIWTGFLMNFFAVLVFKISVWAPASPHFQHQQAFATVLQGTERIVVASFIAFLFGSFLNAFVMSKMKILQHGRNFSARAVASTIVGEGADSLVFFTIAFSGILHRYELVMLILTQTALKTGYEVLALPLTNYVVKWVKKHEQTNVFDNDISYNPFKIKDIE